MEKSIQRFLTINLLLSVSLSLLLGIVANFFLKHENIKLHLDAELSQRARGLDSFLYERLDQKQISLIQRKTNQIPHETSAIAYDKKTLDAVLTRLINSTQFQIWDLRTNRLILRSTSAPAIPLDNSIGYNYANYQAHKWRTYSIENDLQYKIVSMQRHDLRLGYEKQVVHDTLIILLCSFFFLICSIQIIVRRGLSSLQKTREALKDKEPSNLNPIQLQGCPSEIHPLMDEINRLMQQLKETLNRERRFASDAAHELKTPLAVMKAQIQVATRQAPEEQIESFKKVVATIDRYDHIIKQLLSLSRTVSQSSLEKTSAVNLSSIAQNVLADLVPIGLKRNIQLELQCPETLPTLNSNPHVISVMLTNIIDNAIKYSHPNDCILTTLSVVNNYVKINVIDHGPGIPDDKKDEVFKRFARIYGSSAQGSGLGLNIVSEILKHLDGSITLIETPGGGLTVSILLPHSDQYSSLV